VFTIFGGFLYEIEPRYAFIGMLACSLPAMFIALVYRKMEVEKDVLVSAEVR
jgi:MFS transporter, PPP family, 3-phenylpropionic acid transporter